MSISPPLSILMPVRNEADFLPAALHSLQRQTLQNWELIVVDDGSNDTTPAILASAAATDCRIHVIRQESRGLVTALNTALAACRAPLVARMDGDDVMHPVRLERQLNYLQINPQIGLVACQFRHFPRSGLKQGMQEYETWQNGLTSHDVIMRDLLVESPFVHPSIMTRRSILEQLGGYRECGWPEDYDLWLRMAAANIKFARLPETYFFWRDHPERATRTMDEYSQDAFRRCKLDYLKKEYLHDCKQVIIAGAGKEGRAWQRLLKQHQIAVSGWIDVDPKKTGQILHGANVRQPDEYDDFSDKLLIAIGVRGARKQFRGILEQRGLQEQIDFRSVC